MLTLQEQKAPAIRFGKVAREDRTASIEQGRRVTVDVDMVYVKQIGEKDETERVASEWLEQMRGRAEGWNGNPPSIPMEWYERAKKLYENFQKGYENHPDGFPVREWAVLTPSQVQNLHAMQTFTIEQIAAWTENAMGMYGMGGRELRDKARMWLESGDKKAEQLAALQVENKALKDQLEKLAKDVAELRAESAEDKPQRGRPRKEPEAA